MDNFKISGKKVMSGVVLSGMVLGSTVLSNVSFNKVFATEEKNFIQTDLFKFLIEHVTEEDVSNGDGMLGWNMEHMDEGVIYCLDTFSLVDLVKCYKIAEIKLEEGNKNAETVQNCLKNIFSDPKLTKEKIWDYFGSLKSGDLSFDKYAADNVLLINACKLAYEKYNDIESPSANDDFPFFQSNSY